MAITLGTPYRLKDISSGNILHVYKPFIKHHIVSHINYGLLVWGIECHGMENNREKVLRLIDISKYITHIDSLFHKLKLLKTFRHSITFWRSMYYRRTWTQIVMYMYLVELLQDSYALI